MQHAGDGEVDRLWLAVIAYLLLSTNLRVQLLGPRSREATHNDAAVEVLRRLTQCENLEVDVIILAPAMRTRALRENVIAPLEGRAPVAGTITAAIELGFDAHCATSIEGAERGNRMVALHVASECCASALPAVPA